MRDSRILHEIGDPTDHTKLSACRSRSPGRDRLFLGIFGRDEINEADPRTQAKACSVGCLDVNASFRTPKTPAFRELAKLTTVARPGCCGDQFQGMYK